MITEIVLAIILSFVWALVFMYLAALATFGSDNDE